MRTLHTPVRGCVCQARTWNRSPGWCWL